MIELPFLIPKSRWYQAIQYRHLGMTEEGIPEIDVRIRWWHPGAWLHVWRMRHATYISIPVAEG